MSPLLALFTPTLLSWVITVLAILSVCIIAVSMVVKIRRDLARQAAVRTDPSENPFLRSTSSDSGFPAAPLEEATMREVRAKKVQAHLHTGLCLYCTDPAHAPLPTCRPVRPFFEGLLRYLNATPNARWAVKTERDSDVPLAVCEKHHEQLVGLFEGAIARERLASAEFATEQRLSLFDFELHGADEAMQAAMRSIRAREPQNASSGGISLNGSRAGDLLRLPKTTNGRSV